MSPPTRSLSPPSRVTRSTQNVWRLPSPTVLIAPSTGKGSVRTPQPRTSAGCASDVGRTLTHQLPKSTPTDESGALYAVSLRSSALQRSDVSHFISPNGAAFTMSRPLTDVRPAPLSWAARLHSE